MKWCARIPCRALLLAPLVVVSITTGATAGDIDYATARYERRLNAVRTSQTITVDGKLTESAWTSALPATDFTQAEPREGAPSAERTEVRVLYDNDTLYFGLRAYDSHVARLVVSDLKKDFTIDANDAFEIVLDTFHDERNGYIFSINAAGAKLDAQMINEGREVNNSWDGVWYVKTSVGEEGWIAEIAIPFRTLKFRNSDVQTWGLNFHRNLRSNIRNEDSYWAPLPRIYSLQRVSLAGTLEGLSTIQSGSNIRIKPYVSSSVAQNPTIAGGKLNSDLGLDVKYGVNSGLTLDLTYNTDFSQVEADEQQINLTRFSLFFPEKREFFVENSGVFRFADSGAGGGGGGGVPGTNGRLNNISNDVFFFSRTIGLSSNASAVPILGGARLTGRAGAYETGLLNIQQRSYAGTGATNFTVARLKRNVLANSDIGVIAMNKETRDSALFNRVVGADGNFRFGQSTTLTAYLARSSAPGVETDNLEEHVAAGYRNRTWQLQGAYTSIGENFVNEMGYVPRRGVKRYTAQVRPDFRPKRMQTWMRSISPHIVLDDLTDRDGRPDTKLVDYHVAVNFQNGGWFEVGQNASLEVLKTPFKINRDIKIAPGTYNYHDYFITARTDPSRRLQLSGRVGTGPFYSGDKQSYTLGGTLRLSYKLNTLVAYTRNNISLAEGRFSTDLLTTRLNYSFSTAMFLNALVQYNSDAQQWSSNVRFNIIHRPLSDFFLVYNEHRNSITSGLMDRAVIAKMTYMVSR